MMYGYMWEGRDADDGRGACDGEGYGLGGRGYKNVVDQGQGRREQGHEGW